MKLINDEITELRIILLNNDKPLLRRVFDMSMIEALNLNTKVVNCYLNNISLPQYSNLTYRDSDM